MRNFNEGYTSERKHSVANIRETINKMEYQNLIDNLSVIVNQNGLGKGKKGFSIQKEVLSICKQLKNSYGIEISNKFLLGLLNNNLTERQRTNKINNLLRGLNLKEENHNKRISACVKYGVDVVEYGLNKWNEPVIKHIRRQQIGKDIIKHEKVLFKFIRV